MPARKIIAGHRSVRGYFPSRKNGRQISFESTFERDFFYLLEMNPFVQSYKEQPMKIELIIDDMKSIYVPDVLAVRSDEKFPVFYEVKPSADDFPVEKKAAMSRWCNDHLALFHIVDGKEIRTDELLRAKFLYPYLRYQSEQLVTNRIIHELRSRDPHTIGSLARTVGCNLAQIYFLIADGVLLVESMPNQDSPVALGKGT